MLTQGLRGVGRGERPGCEGAPSGADARGATAAEQAPLSSALGLHVTPGHTAKAHTVVHNTAHLLPPCVARFDRRDAQHIQEQLDVLAVALADAVSVKGAGWEGEGRGGVRGRRLGGRLSAQLRQQLKTRAGVASANAAHRWSMHVQLRFTSFSLTT